MKGLPSFLRVFIVLALCIQMVACGTILYPERKGQRDGRLDIGVVLLDGVGLLFFIIPGVIAYAVDFSNGTIYLPRTSWRHASLYPDAIKTIKFDTQNYTPDSLRRLIRTETGCDINWHNPRLQTIKLKNKDEIAAYFAQAAQSQLLLVGAR